ncbi:hypothetical protein DFP72DRAFT_1089079 [Ephemerocybe angulata]|uniref:Uncharacterized protein n=1 Tax=Ephemerocybe angulata TaxID=980116 RepID=A0A8H6MEL4_9AGAR|nr:hypothetical protein DFP72DRAFT_1089079 [Tulosesus angulatus]
MSLYPAPSPRHAEPTIQPSYFTSSLYTEALREDISDLVAEFQEQYTANASEAPFSVFKRTWRAQKWHLLQLRVFDDRTPSWDIKTSHDLEKTKTCEPLFTRATTLLALYTFYSTQPLETIPAIWHLKHIPIPIDHLRDLQTIADSLDTSDFASLRRPAAYVLRFLREGNVFLILPNSNLHPENPRSLPRETYLDHGRIASADAPATKKKGRPTKNDKTRKMKSAMHNLEGWLDKTRPFVELPPPAVGTSASASAAPKVEGYKLIKAELLDLMATEGPGSEGHAAILKANEFILQRLKEVREVVPHDDDSVEDSSSAGIGRVELAVEDLERGLNRGVLDLLEGSGKR